ncbi:MAG: TolA protein [Hyphomicrobiales bacterium]|nr:TolA protein [Hyphomicrobiales bacterium]
MKFSATEPGMIVSGVAHTAMLLATLVAFSDAPKFQEAQESVPVEVVTDAQFNEIMRGEKTAKEMKPQPPRADKVADVEESKPEKVVNEAKVDTVAPPPKAPRQPDPGEDEKPVPLPPQRVAALPQPEPVKPEPVKPEPPLPPLPTPRPPLKAEPEKPEPPKEAEAIEPPKPPVRPREEPKKVEAPTPPKAPPKPREPPRPDPSQIAKLLEQKKAEDAPKPASKPKSGDESSDRPRPDPAAIAKLLSREASQQKPSTGRAINQTASIGTATANAPKMSPSLWGQLDGLLQDQYKQCWSYLGLSSGQRYIPQIKVEYNRTGALVGTPALLNPPSDPALRSLAESALRAVRRCDPLKIPAQYAPYFEQWRARILRFDPEEMQG